VDKPGAQHFGPRCFGGDDDFFCDLKTHCPIFNNIFIASIRDYNVMEEDVLMAAKLNRGVSGLIPKD